MDQSKINEQAKEEVKATEKTKPPDVKYYRYILISIVVLIVGFVV